MKLSNTVRNLAAVFLVVGMLVQPATAFADNQSTFNSLSQSEKIAYLLGMIAQLQDMLDRSYDNNYYYYSDARVVSVRSGNSNSRSSSRLIDVETLSATNIRDDEAKLRGELDLDGEDEALVWFEYGEDDDDLDDRTAKRRVTDSRGDDVSFTATIEDLDEDEKYYFRAVAEDEDGDREYGRIRSFTTDDDDRNSYDYSLTISDRSVDEDDWVEVDWELPRREEGRDNWIGLYERGDDNDEYIHYEYLEDDDHGTVTFQMRERGTFEFRLFLDNSYDDEITSARVEVD